MRFETGRQIKAALLISMLAVAEAHNMDVLFKMFGEKARKSTAPEEQSNLLAKQVETMKGNPEVKGHAHIVARQVEAMLADPKLREQANHIAKEMEALMMEPKFEKEAKDLAKEMEAMTANSHLKEQAQQIAKQLEAMTAGPEMHEQAKAFVQQAEAMKANPHVKRQAELFDKELDAMISNPHFQQMKEATANPNSQERMNALTSDPTFQAQVKSVAEQAEAMMADPLVREQTKAFKDQMTKMKAKSIGEDQVKLMAEQLEALKSDAVLQEHAKLIAKRMNGIATDPVLQKQAHRIAEQVRVMMMDASNTHFGKRSPDNMVDSLVDKMSGELFDHALKVSGPTSALNRNTYAPAWANGPSRSAFRKTSFPLGAQKEKELVAAVAQKEQRRAVAQKEPVTVMAQKEREGNEVQDALAGLTVAFSLLSKAIACSSIVGVSPLVGLWSAVVMGVSAPLLGSRPGVISGTAAVVTVPLSQLVAARGTDYIAPAILLASALEVAFGAFQLSKYTVLVTDAVLAGFLNALGIILFESQGKIFTKAPDQQAAVLIAAICVVIVQFLPKLTKAVPSSLVGLIVSTGVGIALNLKLEKLVDKAGPATFQGGLSSLPTVIDFGKVGAQLTNPEILAFVVPAAFTIAFISILETLLAGRVVDELKDEPICTFTPDGKIECFTEDQDENDLDVPTRSVLALGTGQFISACLGGFGGCGLIPQTVLNIKSGGGGALSSTAYAASMATFVLLLAPAVGQITSPALAGIFLTVAYDTVQWEATANTVKAALPGNSANPTEARIELVALLVAAGVCYKVDAALGIVAGVAVEQTLRKVTGTGDE